MASAARSLTEPPGLRNSALPNMRQPVAWEAAFSSMSGVLPMLSMKPVRISMQARLSAGRSSVKMGGRMAEDELCQVEGRRAWRVDINDRAQHRREGGAEMIFRLDAKQTKFRHIDSLQ